MRPYPGTLHFIDELRAAGIKVGVFSASRNAEAVLRNAGVFDRFDAKVDGSDAAELGLPGKPDPAMLLEAARRPDAAPGRTAVVEDAIAGVAAGALRNMRDSTKERDVSPRRSRTGHVRPTCKASWVEAIRLRLSAGSAS